MIQLNDIALFVEVVKTKSFRRAATAMSMPISTASRRISALEEMVGLRLLHRTTRNVEVTEAGQVYFDRVQPIVDQARYAHEQLGEIRTEPTGVLRLSLPVDYATTYLAPLIAEFSRDNPGISFDLDLTPRNVDLVTEPFDLVVRMRPQPDSHLIARGLAHLRPQLYASPGYLATAGEPASPFDLAYHQCIGFPKTSSWRLHRGGEQVEVAISGRFKLNSPGMARKLAALDLGLVLIPAELVHDELGDGRLQRVLPEWHGEPAPVYMLTESKLLPAKTRHFIDFLKSRLNNADGLTPPEPQHS
jgi:DNA-binding transcriptional LysR family regulator